MRQKRTPMVPVFRWVLVDRDGVWRVANETYENKRIALEVRGRVFGPQGGVEPVRSKSETRWRMRRMDVVPVRVRISPARKAKR